MSRRAGTNVGMNEGHWPRPLREEAGNGHRKSCGYSPAPRQKSVWAGQQWLCVCRHRVGTLALVLPPRLRLAGLMLTDSLSPSGAGVFFPEQEPGLGSTPKKLTSTRACFGRWQVSSELTARVYSTSRCQQLPWHGYQRLDSHSPPKPSLGAAQAHSGATSSPSSPRISRFVFCFLQG